MNVAVIFYSLHGHTYKMAKAVVEGAKSAGAEVRLLQVDETLSDEVIEKMNATESKAQMKSIPIVTSDDLIWADAIIIGTPTRFGNMTAQMRTFLDKTGGLWAKNALVGKMGSVFTSSGTQHGGQESTILSVHITLLHHGMIIVGLPYSEKRQSKLDEVSGGGPYGASTIAGTDNKREPSKNELAMAKYQGKHVAQLAKKLFD